MRCVASYQYQAYEIRFYLLLTMTLCRPRSRSTKKLISNVFFNFKNLIQLLVHLNGKRQKSFSRISFVTIFFSKIFKKGNVTFLFY